MSDLLVWPLSPQASGTELTFRETEEYGDPEEFVRRWMAKKGLRQVFSHVLSHAGFIFRGVGVELGAGSCWLSSLISRCPDVERIYAVEFSRRRLETLAPVAMVLMEADTSKIVRIVGDFHHLVLPDSSIDFVAVDAAIHHSQAPHLMLREAARVLKQGGWLIALREPVIPKWRRALSQETWKAQHGTFENIYTHDHYMWLFRSVGLRPNWIPGDFVLSARARWRGWLKKTFLRGLNGLLFADYIYIAEKVG